MRLRGLMFVLLILCCTGVWANGPNPPVSSRAPTVNDEGQLHVVLRGTVDSNNTTSVTLGGGATFTGAATDILDYGIVFVSVYSDQGSATDGLSLQQSCDGTNWDITDEYTIDATAGKTFSIQPACKYFRVVYTNGATPQTVFRLATVLKKTNSKPSSHRISDSIINDDDAELVKAVLTGENPSGAFINFSATNGGNFKISLEEFESGVSTNSNSQLKTTLYDEGGIPASVDDSTESLQVVEYEHHEIHAGDFYRAEFQKDIPNEGTAVFAITTPDTTKWLHFRPAVDVELEAAVMLYENPTSVTGGAAVTPRNANRNSNNTSGATVVTDPTIDTTGAIVLGNLVEGSGRSSGGESGSMYEWILKQNTTYLIVVTNQATGASNECNIRCQWYEHTNKN